MQQANIKVDRNTYYTREIYMSKIKQKNLSNGCNKTKMQKIYWHQLDSICSINVNKCVT